MNEYLNRSLNQSNQGHIGFQKSATKSEVVNLAKEYVVAETRCNNLRAQNCPSLHPSAEWLVEARASIQIADDRMAMAKAVYDRAFKSWAAGGYQEDPQQEPAS